MNYKIELITVLSAVLFFGIAYVIEKNRSKKEEAL